MDLTQDTLANWIEAVADTWRVDDERLDEFSGDIPPDVQRDIDDARPAYELATDVRLLTDADPLSAALIHQIEILTADDLVSEGFPIKQLRTQMHFMRRRLNTDEAKYQAVETVVRSLLARQQG